MKRVAIVAHFFPPEPCAAANRVSALADALVADGHEVTVVTGFPSFPSGEIPAEYLGRKLVRERVRGVQIVRVWTYASPRLGRRERILNWLSVAFGSALYLLTCRRLDVVVASSPPITLALPAIAGAVRHRAALIADIRDVFPDVAIKIGETRAGSPLARALGLAADALYRTARSVVCVTESARDEIAARHVPPAKITVRANGFDAVVPGPAPGFRRAPGDFVVVYVGNMGLATGLDVVIDAAARLRDDPRIRFVMIGGGADAARIEGRAHAEDLRNIEFLGVLPRQEAFGVLSESDACVIPLRANVLDSLPTKMFDAMVVGCPIVLSAGGEALALLERAGAGVSAPAEDGAALAAAIARLAADPSAREKYGRSGEAYVRAHYDRSKIMRDYAAAIGAL